MYSDKLQGKVMGSPNLVKPKDQAKHEMGTGNLGEDARTSQSMLCENSAAKGLLEIYLIASQI